MAQVVFDRVTKVYNRHPAVCDISLTVADGELLVIVGPSGCGKSTSLRMTAGLESVTSGSISIGSDVVNDVPVQERDVSMVFQTHALYPTMTVAENLGFPLTVTGMTRADIAAHVDRVADRLALRPLLPRSVRTLSVGEQQRVAMGRAIVRHPRVFLMDEPLSSLDAPLRVHTRAEILELQRELGVTTLYVTHDQVEAMTMGDRVAVMREGEILQCAPPQELYDLPANAFVAAFIGSPRMNLFHTTLVTGADGTRWVRFGDTYLALDAHSTRANVRLHRQADGPLIVGVRPDALSAAPAGQPFNTIDVTVSAVEMLGSESLVYFTAPVDVLRWSGAIDSPTRRGSHDASTRNVMCARLWPPMRLDRGTPIRLAVDTRRFYFFDRDGVLIH